MTSIRGPICLYCKRLNKDAKLTCEAFPDGIPNSIITSIWDHRKPYHGDNDMQFDPANKAASDYAAELFGK